MVWRPTPGASSNAESGAPGVVLYIVMHLGSSIKAYRDLCRRWTPAGCLAGDGDTVKLHGTYAHWAGPDQKEPIQILRFRGRRCCCVVTFCRTCCCRTAVTRRRSATAR